MSGLGFAWRSPGLWEGEAFIGSRVIRFRDSSCVLNGKVLKRHMLRLQDTSISYFRRLNPAKAGNPKPR